MWRRLVPLVLLALGAAGLLSTLVAGAADKPAVSRQAVVANVARNGFPATQTPSPTPPPPTPTPKPPPYDGPVASIYLASASIWGYDPIEVRDTRWVNGVETFEDPTAPRYISHYRRFGNPGHERGNSIFAAHVNYYGYGNGPFARLTSTRIGDTIWVRMANGDEYGYTVNWVDVVPLAYLDMDLVVYPNVAPGKERLTLISCAGDFIPGVVGGEYTSRVVVFAERYVP